MRYLGQKRYHHPLFYPSSLSVFYDWFWQAFFMIQGMQNCTSAKKSWVHPLNEPLNYETVRRCRCTTLFLKKVRAQRKQSKKDTIFTYFWVLLQFLVVVAKKVHCLFKDCICCCAFSRKLAWNNGSRKISLNKQMSNFKSNSKNCWIWHHNSKSYEALFKNVKWICVLVHKLNSTLCAPAVIIAITAKFSYFT